VAAQQERPFAAAGVDANGSPDWTAGLRCARAATGICRTARSAIALQRPLLRLR
jgi:hypothetical protein